MERGTSTGLATPGPATEEQRVGAFGRLAEALARPLDMDELFRAAYRGTSELMDATVFLLGLYDEGSQTVHMRQIISGKELEGGGTMPLGSGFTSEVIRTGRPRLIRKWSQEGPRIQVLYGSEEGKLTLPQSGMTIPLWWGGRVIGVLTVQSYESEKYTEQDLATFHAIGHLSAIAMRGAPAAEARDDQLSRRVSELEAVLGSMNDALIIVGQDGRVVRLNQAARTLLQLDAHMVVLGQPLSLERAAEWPQDAQDVVRELAPMIEALQRGVAVSEIEVVLDRAGRRALSFSTAPLRDPGGQPAGGVIVFRDVTERREVERLKDEMLSIASHDLRTPLTVIRGHAELLRRKIEAGAAHEREIASSVVAIETHAVRLSRLLDLLLDLSRIETGRLALECAPTDLGALVRATAEGIQSTTERHTLEVGGTAQIIGSWDGVRLTEVVENLLANAVKFSPGGGRIEVRVETDGAEATVSVTDPGVGLSAEQLSHVFEKYYRTEQARTLEGTGLGLYICQGIVRAHSGRIWAASPGPGKGSTFAFALPVEPPPAAA